MEPLAKVISNLEQEIGEPYTQQEKAFALDLVRNGGNKSAAAREAGINPGSAAQRGYEFANDPKVQKLIDEINKYQTVQLTEEFVTNSLVKEAITAEAPRDRINALQLLGKTRKLKMFTDTIEQTNTYKTDQDLIQEIEKKFGEEAAQKAREELGLE